MTRSIVCRAACLSLLALASACGGSQPMQEDVKAPGGGAPTTPGPQTGDEPMPSMETPDDGAATPGDTTGGSPESGSGTGTP